MPSKTKVKPQEETLVPKTKPLEREKIEEDHRKTRRNGRKVKTDGGVTQLLIHGKRLIKDRNNWDQGVYNIVDHNGNNRYCAVGAIIAAAEGPFGLTSERYSLVREANKYLDKASGGHIMRLNDRGRPRKAHKRVIKAYSKAIVMARENGA